MIMMIGPTKKDAEMRERMTRIVDVKSRPNYSSRQLKWFSKKPFVTKDEKRPVFSTKQAYQLGKHRGRHRAMLASLPDTRR